MKQHLMAFRQRILLLAFLPGVIVSLLMGIIYLSRQYVELDDQLMAKTLVQSEQKADIASLLLNQTRHEDLQALIRMLLEDMDIRAVGLFNEQGKEIVHVGPRLTATGNLASLMGPSRDWFRTDHVIQVANPITSPATKNFWLVDYRVHLCRSSPQPISLSGVQHCCHLNGVGTCTGY